MRTTTKGRFGRFGGQYVPETLMGVLRELEDAYDQVKDDAEFHAEFEAILRQYVGRPSPLYRADRVSERVGCTVYLKREDLNHTGAHKINNTIGQGLLAKRMGKRRIIAETGAGQHGVATATVAALFGMECVVYMGEEDIRRQELNCFKMELLGATVSPVTSGTRTLKDAINEAIRDWMTNVADTFYLFGTVAGPHPYPTMVRDFQSIVGREARAQCFDQEGRLPDHLFACVGGGSNAMGLFYPFIEDNTVQMHGVEAAGRGISTGDHAAPLNDGSFGVLHGAAQYMMQDADGQVAPAHSVAAGLDYPGVGPEHCHLRDIGRAVYHAVTDTEALDAFQELTRLEGIIPALESSHAVAQVLKMAGQFDPGEIIIINLSGRGDKDCYEVRRLLNEGTGEH
ncbi:MAG: tryptophan synthase subunit beta [Acidobacteriota bacterium]|nr:tryptophan synthase subunit beta [Acidobacteriota bacterium]